LRRVATCHYDSRVHDKLKFSLKLAPLTVLLASLTWTISAQQKSDATQAPFNAAAYRTGERLTYNVNFASFGSAAHVELFVAAHGTFQNRDTFELRAHVETAGVVNVALLSLNNDYTTYVDAQTGLPFRARQVVRQAVRTSEFAGDYNQPAATNAIPSSLRIGELPGTFDLLSGLYRLRALPLADGSSYFMNVVSDGAQHFAEVKVAGRQMIKTGAGSFNTIVTRINVKSGPDYDLRIYFSDDERHLPVLVTAKLKTGEIRAELAGSEMVGAASNSVVIPFGITPPTSTVRTDPKRIVVPLSSGNSNQTSTTLAALDLPFRIGEQLNYQVYLGSSPLSVGAITFGVRNRGRYFNRDGLLISATAQTTAAGARVFPVTDQIRSYVDPVTLLPFRTELTLSEGKYRLNRNYDLDQNRGAATPEKGARIDIPVGTHDLISLLYALRTFDLTPPKRNAISIMATDRPLTLFITAQRRETIELSGQKISAILLTLTTDDPQPDRLQVRIWVGDDSRHLPLRIAAVTELGSVRADLAISVGVR
jgi:hypothetical protein